MAYPLVPSAIRVWSPDFRTSNWDGLCMCAFPNGKRKKVQGLEIYLWTLLTWVWDGANTYIHTFIGNQSFTQIFFVDTLELSFFLFFLILSSELLAVLTDTHTHFFPLNNSGCTCFLIKSQNIFKKSLMNQPRPILW